MDNKEKQIVNEAVEIIVGECQKHDDCGGCPFIHKRYGSCKWKFGVTPRDWELPFKKKTERHWLSGKLTEVFEDGG